MSKKPDLWMPLYIGDYLGDTARLSTEGHGAYLLLLMDYWRSGAPPDDDEVLASITKLGMTRWKKLRPQIAAFFDIKNGFWFQKRMEEEIERAQKNKQERSAAGKLGAERRWQTHGKSHGEGIANGIANGMANSSQNDGPLPSPSPSSLKTKELVSQVVRASDAQAQAKPLTNYDDPANRKARWQQKIESYLYQTLPDHQAKKIIVGYLAGDKWALEKFEEADRAIKARKQNSPVALPNARKGAA